jgi:hypothetical protein
MKCWNSAFNAQGPRVIIVVVQVGAGENICSSSSVCVQEKGQTRWNSSYHQDWWFSESATPPRNIALTTYIPSSIEDQGFFLKNLHTQS